MDLMSTHLNEQLIGLIF
ncbi:unnamed protein product, partial [Rhizophagus irregularis]